MVRGIGGWMGSVRAASRGKVAIALCIFDQFDDAIGGV
jgi:hypothetical protein